MRPLIVLLALSACASPPGGDAGPVIPGADAGPTMALDSLHRADEDLQYSATVRFPVLANAGLHTDAVNAMLRDDALRTIDDADFQPDPEVASTSVEDRSIFESIELEVNVEVERLDDRVFSANRFVYAYTGGAHGNFWFDPGMWTS